MTDISEIDLQVMWNRLLAVVEEQGQTLVRTAFSTSAREAGDISAGVFDLRGRMLAQAVTGTPGHINTMARLGRTISSPPSPPPSMKRGRHLRHQRSVEGHRPPLRPRGGLADFSWTDAWWRCSPAPRTWSTSAASGRRRRDARSTTRGCSSRCCRLARAGVMNEDLLAMIRANVREPVQVIGDVYALIACNDIGSRRLVRDDGREFGLHRSRHGSAKPSSRAAGAAMTEAIARLPKGSMDRLDAHRRLRGADRSRRAP